MKVLFRAVFKRINLCTQVAHVKHSNEVHNTMEFFFFALLSGDDHISDLFFSYSRICVLVRVCVCS